MLPNRFSKRVRSPTPLDHIDGAEAYQADYRRSKRLNLPYQPISDLSLQQLRRDLRQEKVRTYDRKDVIPLHSISRFWTSGYKLEKFLREFGCPKRLIDQILENSLRVFTALILVEWSSDERFRGAFDALFPDDKNVIWNDDSLNGAISAKSGYLEFSDDEADLLESNLDLVSVPVLNKDTKTVHEHSTLPITSKTEIGKGAYGKVYKIQIAKGCLMVENASGCASSNEVCNTT